MNKTAAAEAPSADDPKREQPARESNIDAIVAFFESGVVKPRELGDVGIELEQIIVHEDSSPVGYSDDHGVAWVLGQLQSQYPDSTTDLQGDLLGLARPGETVTIEPAAQIELSAGPFSRLDAARDAFESFEKLLAGVLEPHGQRALAVGYHPTASARSLELIPKRRYQFMDLYLGDRDVFGPCMMRASASTQVSIDYTSTADCLRKLRLAFALVPLFALICDNAAVFEGRRRSRKLVRTAIWQHVDPDRCGLVPGALEPSFDLRRYAEYLLDAVAILVPCEKEEWCYSERTFGEIYAERTMTRAEIEHAASMFFTDVRLKTYLEIRPADAMPVSYVIAYSALVKGLFYSPVSLDALDELFCDVREEDFLQAKEALMESGYDAEVYARPAGELCDRLVELARAGLPASERGFLDPLAKLVARRVTLADLAERGGLS